MKPKKKTRKKRGHRQEITRLLINSISLDGSVLASEESTITVTSETEATSELPATAETPETIEITAQPVAEETAAQ